MYVVLRVVFAPNGCFQHGCSKSVRENPLSQGSKKNNTDVRDSFVTQDPAQDPTDTTSVFIYAS